MISEENLAQEYINIVNSYYPKAGETLRYCHLKIIKFYLKHLDKYIYYIAIYYPGFLKNKLFSQQDAFKEIAENMGLMQVVFLNANRIIRDPLSRIKQQDPRFWLELTWIANQNH